MTDQISYNESLSRNLLMLRTALGGAIAQYLENDEIIESGKVYGVRRKLFFYEYTTLRDVETGDGDFINYTSSDVIDSAYSDEHGFFQKELPEGITP